MTSPVKFVNTALPDVVCLQRIRQEYPKKGGGTHVVLDDFDLLIENKPDQGQFVVLLGLSGSGKSTALRFVAGLERPTSGEVLIHGKPRGEYGAVGMVFQDYSSFPWYTVLRNVALPLEMQGVPRSEREDRAMEMIKSVGLSGHEYKFAQSPGLSGGQLQRVAIARSLISNPEIILMDEPFGALDGVTRGGMQMLLAELWESLQATIIFVTHDISEAVFLGDDIYVLDPRIGKISAHIPVDIPLGRELAMKRTPRFNELVAVTEEALYATGRPLPSS